MAESNYTVDGRSAYLEWVKRIREESKHGFHCEHCGKYAIRRPGGTKRAKWYPNRWCSMECRKLAHASLRREVAWIRGMASAHRKLAREAARRDSAAKICTSKRASHQFACVNCGKSCSEPVRPGPPRIRCETCRSEAKRKSRRIAKSARRARIRSLPRESIDPLEVFERDRWRCHMCGSKTPRRLRGSLDDAAPELDHVVPLALGGSHTWSNVACACRSCNGTKGAKALGQLHLPVAA